MNLTGDLQEKLEGRCHEEHRQAGSCCDEQRGDLEDLRAESNPPGGNFKACDSFSTGAMTALSQTVTYSRMTEELCNLLQSFPGKGSAPSVLMGCFETILDAPIPQDLRAGHLQEALSVFTYLLAQSAS
ncbi:hypothetical protein KSP40_PGU002921 [Platanthera guangdongensis]|uniref:Uncharacterized protein n=1 Tax=Platanthera guangdongensis TaxID=2320717 RepID=A0ABR2LLD1_9ASPA